MEETEGAGSILGPFVLSSTLGSGGGGVVHEVHREGEAFALKVLHAELSLSARERARFLDEARRMQRVTHPGLLPLIEVGVLPDGRPYLLMPRLHGETLARRLERGPLPLPEALAIFGLLARAVEAIHEAGMLHRDIKPENVFLARIDGVVRPYLLDFGIAREIGAGASTTTEDGRVRGTPAYMAPERFFGTPASVESDVYELGVVLYMMLVGHLPWPDGASASARLAPPPPAGVPAPLASVVLRALSMRPEIRPASAAQLAGEVTVSVSGPPEIEAARRTEDLPIASAHESGPSAPLVVPTASAPSAGRRRWFVLAAFALLGAVGIVSAATRRDPVEVARSTEPAPVPQPALPVGDAATASSIEAPVASASLEEIPLRPVAVAQPKQATAPRSTGRGAGAASTVASKIEIAPAPPTPSTAPVVQATVAKPAPSSARAPDHLLEDRR